MKKRFGTLTLALFLACSLAIPAGAVETDDSPENMEDIDMIVSFYTDREACHIFENDGTEITDAFLAQHQSDYEAGNYSVIIQDFLNKTLSASYPDLDDGTMPLATVNYGKTTNLKTSFVYRDTTYTYTVKIKVTGQVNDYNLCFQTLNYATKTSFTSTCSSATLSQFTPYGLDIDAYVGMQTVKIGLSIGGQSLLHQWRVSANAKTDELNATLLP